MIVDHTPAGRLTPQRVQGHHPANLDRFSASAAANKAARQLARERWLGFWLFAFFSFALDIVMGPKSAASGSKAQLKTIGEALRQQNFDDAAQRARDVLEDDPNSYQA